MGYLYRRCSPRSLSTCIKTWEKKYKQAAGAGNLGQSGEGGGQYTRAQFNGVIAESVQHNAFYKLPKAISKPTFFYLHRTKTKRKKKAEKAQTKFFAHSRLLTGGGNGEGEGCSNGMSRCGQINAKCYAKPNKVEHKHTHTHTHSTLTHMHICAHTFTLAHSQSHSHRYLHARTFNSNRRWQ